MTTVNDLTNRVDRLPQSYGVHLVTGKGTIHTTGTDEVLFQRALGWASWKVGSQYRGRGWNACRKLYYQGFEIPADHYSFHSGGPTDAPDAFFPNDIPHRRASYVNGKLPDGMKVDNQPEDIDGVFETTCTADYNEDGDQIDEDGAIVTLPDPDDALFYNAKPGLQIIDAWRRTRRGMLSVNWPVWCHYRDYCAELIDWDDGALTPHQVFLTAGSGGALAPGTVIWVRIATLKGGDISSASKDRASDGESTASFVVGSGGAVSIEWASQVDRGATGYRVYVGTAEGAEDRYFTIGSGATNVFLLTTLAGATMGAPPEVATAGLIRQIPRFESHLFMVPPFDYITFLDKIAQITCMDWQCSGGLWRFYTPEIREPVFTVNMAEVRGLPVRKADRRTKYDQIIVDYRNLDDEFLSQADPPVQIDRGGEGLSTFQINMGCAYRSQAERVGEFWAKRLIDSDWFVGGDNSEFSPKTYVVLPGDTIEVTHDVPDWEDVSFYIETKEEPEDTKAGYQMTGRTAGAWYSDTDHNPLPRPLPPARLNPFSPPPVVIGCTLTEEVVEVTTGDAFEVIRGAVTFLPFVGPARQRGRVWIKPPSAGAYKATEITIFPDPTTLQAAFEIKAIEAGTYTIKVVTESDPFGVTLAFGTHPAFTLNVTGDLLKGPVPTDLLGTFFPDTDDLLSDWSGQTGKGASKRELYDLQFSVPGDGDFSTVREVTIDRAIQQTASFIPWEFDSDDDPDTVGPGAGSGFVLVAPGGFDASTHPGGDPHSIALRSAVKALAYDLFVFQFEIAPNASMPTKIGVVPYDEDPATSEYGLWWEVGGNYVHGDAQPDGEVISEPAIARTWIKADGVEVHPILPGNRPGIVIGRDRIPRFVLNYESGHSVPILTSARRVKTPGLYLAYAVCAAPGLSSVRNANWIRSVPEFVYNSAMQRADNSSALPAQIKWRVRQHSFYTGGPPSDWVVQTSNRP